MIVLPEMQQLEHRGDVMRYAAVLLVSLFLEATPSLAQTISITGPDRPGMLEGVTYAITWASEGIKSVSIVAHGVRTPLGTKSRGRFHIAVAEGIPAKPKRARWTVPWIDSIRFLVKLKGYNALGQLAAMDERRYSFRPAVLANRTKDGIYLDLHESRKQRLYVQKNYEIIRAYLSSSSESYRWRPPGDHSRVVHDHAGVFKVLEKKRVHWSTLFRVWMPWAMRYHGGHFIHGTSPNLYRLLGGPASHGCNRLTREHALELYRMTPLGTRVEVIGPER